MQASGMQAAAQELKLRQRQQASKACMHAGELPHASTTDRDCQQSKHASHTAVCPPYPLPVCDSVSSSAGMQAHAWSSSHSGRAEQALSCTKQPATICTCMAQQVLLQGRLYKLAATHTYTHNGRHFSLTTSVSHARHNTHTHPKAAAAAVAAVAEPEAAPAAKAANHLQHKG